LENTQGSLQSGMPGSNSETRGRFCNGLGSNIVVQYSAGPIITLHGQITAREYVDRLGNQVHGHIARDPERETCNSTTTFGLKKASFLMITYGYRLQGDIAIPTVSPASVVLVLPVSCLSCQCRICPASVVYVLPVSCLSCQCRACPASAVFVLPVSCLSCQCRVRSLFSVAYWTAALVVFINVISTNLVLHCNFGALLCC
jgi:hypothetical protein